MTEKTIKRIAKAVFILTPAALLISWFCFRLFNTYWPTTFVCGHVVRSGDEAIRIVWDRLKEDRKNQKEFLNFSDELRGYTNVFSECCSASRQKGTWGVHVRLRTRCGYIVDFFADVAKCGGEIVSMDKGVTPVQEHINGTPQPTSYGDERCQ